MKKSLLLCLCLFGILISNLSFAAKTAITNIAYTTAPQKFGINFATNSRIANKVFSLNNPKRIVIDLQNTTFKQKLPAVPSNDLVLAIKDGWQSEKNLRIVLILKTSVHFSKIYSAQSLTIDLYTDHSSNNETPAAAPIVSIASSPPESVTTIKTSATTSEKSAIQPIVPTETTIPPSSSPSTPKVILSENNKSNPIIIVIDPGHGGKDPGAIGPSGTREKDVVLAISKDLAEELNNQTGFQAVLTRNSDYFIPLRQRLNIAQHYHGNMFIAVHADAYLDSYAHGASIFALSLRGATSEAARWLAKKENESELGHVLSDKNMVLRSVLIDLAQTASITTSLEIANVLIRQLKPITPLHHNFVEQAAFVVLKEPDIPSLLVETGFISNTDEEQKLNNPEYQKTIAQALANGIISYYRQHPLLNH